MGIILVSIENKDERGLLDHENGYLSFFLWMIINYHSSVLAFLSDFKLFISVD
jgi:hypothetical protein